MTTVRRRLDMTHHFRAAPTATAIVLIVLAVFGFKFISHEPTTGKRYQPAQDRSSVITVAGWVYDVVEAGPQRTGLPVPVSLTARQMQMDYKSNGWHGEHVLVHGANIMVTFHKEPAVCIWVPVIVNGPKEPAIVSC